MTSYEYLTTRIESMEKNMEEMKDSSLYLFFRNARNEFVRRRGNLTVEQASIRRMKDGL